MATLLLADDSVTIQRVIELTFAPEGINVVTVADGNEAMARVEADRPDLVLVDVGLPGIDGYRLAERVKHTSNGAAVPVLLLTGAFEPIDETRARQSGCDGVLVKPFEPQRLVSTVKSLLAGQRPEHLWPHDMPRIEPPATPAARATPPPQKASVPTEPPTPLDIAEVGTLAESPAMEAEFESGLDDLDLAFSRLDPVAPPGRLDAGTASDFRRDIQELRSTAPPATPEPTAPMEVSVPLSHLPIEEAMAIEEDDLQWDLPAPATTVQAIPLPVSFPDEPVVELPPVAVVPPVADAPEFTPPTAPVDESEPVDTPTASVQPDPAPAEPEPEPEPEPRAPVTTDEAATDFPPPTSPRSAPPPSLSAAFSALLAAERSRTERPPAPPAQVSEAVIEEVVRRVVARLADEVARRVALESADRLIREEIERINR